MWHEIKLWVVWAGRSCWAQSLLFLDTFSLIYITNAKLAIFFTRQCNIFCCLTTFSVEGILTFQPPGLESYSMRVTTFYLYYNVPLNWQQMILNWAEMKQKYDFELYLTWLSVLPELSWKITIINMGIRWHICKTEQVIKSVSQINWMKNFQSIICVTQSLAN